MIYILIGLFLVGQNGELKGEVLAKYQSEKACEIEREIVERRKDLSGALCVRVGK